MVLVTFAVLVLALGPGKSLAAEEQSPASTFGPGQLDELSAMDERANILWSQGDHAGTRDLEEQVLESRTRTLRAEHWETLATEADLAMVSAALEEADPDASD